MILLMIRMKTPSDKRMELSQAITSLVGLIRKEKGCKRCDFYRQIEDENALCVLEQWDSRENLKLHLESRRFEVLRGAMSLLREPYEIMVHNCESQTSWSGVADA
jgi:quinol monooxygenase YgiN